MSAPAVDINTMEDFLWKYFGECHFVTADACPNCRLTKGHFSVQDIAPALADFLHEHGVDVDWTDRSRYGKESQ